MKSPTEKPKAGVIGRAGPLTRVLPDTRPSRDRKYQIGGEAIASLPSNLHRKAGNTA